MYSTYYQKFSQLCTLSSLLRDTPTFASHNTFNHISIRNMLFSSFYFFAMFKKIKR